PLQRTATRVTSMVSFTNKYRESHGQLNLCRLHATIPRAPWQSKCIPRNYTDTLPRSDGRPKGPACADCTGRPSPAESDRLEPAFRMHEQRGAFDDAHFLGAIGRGALQHGVDGGRGVAERVGRVRSAHAGRYE